MVCAIVLRKSMRSLCVKAAASLAQLAEHALRKRTVVGSIPTGGFFGRRIAQSRAVTHMGKPQVSLPEWLRGWT